MTSALPPVDPNAARAVGAIGVGSLFAQIARAHPDRQAVVWGESVLTYGALNARVNRLARALARLGIGPGDRIAILSENHPDYLALMLAAAKLGAILACQNWRQARDELAHCLSLCEAETVFVSERFAEKLAETGLSFRHTIVLGAQLETLLAPEAESDPPPSAFDPETGFLILYTSGTTGAAKGALISQRAMIWRAVLAEVDGHLPRGEGFVAWSPLFHMGAADYAVASMVTGGHVVIVDGFDVEAILRIVETRRIGFLPLMPGTVDRLIAPLGSSGIRPRGIGVCGAMPDLIPPAELAEITTLLGAPFRSTFASTETGSAPASRARVAIGEAPAAYPKIQSSYCEIRLVDADGNDVPDGEPGEILVRGPSLFSGYYKAPEATVACFVGGWYAMGDVLRREPDGRLFYMDRVKYLIKSGGENIYPAEIERVLMQSDRIAEAVVVRRPDARWGEVPVAFVAARDPGLTPDEVIALCRGRIASYKLPKEVRFIALDSIPRSTSGKVLRADLEALL